MNIAIKKQKSTTFAQLGVLLLFIFLLPGHSLFAQVGINTKSPDPSAALHVVAPNKDKGVLIPRLTEQQRNNIQNPATGLIIYNTNNDCLETHSGGGNGNPFVVQKLFQGVTQKR